MQTGRGNKFVYKLEFKLQRDLYKILQQDELVWFQRYRAKWLNGGDRNMKYYHLKVVNMRRTNQVQMLCDTNGIWVEDEHQLQSMAIYFYMNLFIEIIRDKAWFQTPVSYLRVSQESLNILSVHVNDTEVR